MIFLKENMRRIRNQNGFSLRDLGELTNMDYSSLSKIERGVIKNPTIKTIDRIAEALGVSLDQLVKL